ncbi:hypothetical protein OQA88_5581 [Cercophora sp. LCS_1]
MTVSGPGSVDGRVGIARLRGHGEGEMVWLENVVLVKPAPVLDDVMGHIESFLARSKPERYQVGMESEKAAFESLREMGFTGSEKWVAMEAGLFFPQWELPERVEVEFIIAVDIHWRLGSPGLARYWEKTGGAASYVPGD